MNPNLRGQRISRQELILESQEVLQNAGVGNHSRAQFLVEVSREVVGSDNPLFCQLQPKIHSHESESWIRAFSLVFQYLTEHSLQSTLSAVEAEFNQGQLPKELTTFKKGEASTHLMRILKFAPPPRGTTFKDRVKQYMNEVKNRDLMILQQDDEYSFNYQSSSRRITSNRRNENTNPSNISRTSPTPRTGSVQSKTRVTKKYDIKPSPQATESRPTVTPKESNKYSTRAKSVTRGSTKKKSSTDDDFIIYEITQQKNQ